MELTIRDWMVIVGVLLIVAVLLDAWRRIHSDKKSTVKVKLADPAGPVSERDAELAWLKELPNGGARVVERGQLHRAAEEDGAERGAGNNADRNVDKNLQSSADKRAAHGSGSRSDGDDVELVQGFSSTEPGGVDDLDWLDGVATQDTAVAERHGGGKLPRDAQTEVFMLNVVARSPQGFRGEDILQILLACDLRFGDMNFFHRHEYEAGRGAIQFSVANMMQPGVFDIDRMADMATPGLVFFVTLPGPDDMMKAYDYMLETAQAVARNLGGDVLDESRSVLTRQATEHSRQQIRELEQRLLAKAR